MSEGRRSFWSSIPGLITGLAGLLTGIVGLGTLAVQQGILGNDSTATTTTVAPGSAAAGGAPSTTEVATFSVSTRTLDFQPADAREKPVTVTNTSNTALLMLSPPRISGDDADRFTPSFGTCTAPLAPNLSCTMKVTFAASGALRRYSAVLQLQAAGVPRGAEVRLSATTIL